MNRLQASQGDERAGARGALRVSIPFHAHAMRIVILQPNLLGDAIMVTPLLRHLRRSLPDARLSFVMGARNLAVAPMFGDLVDEVLPYIKKPMPLLSLL